MEANCSNCKFNDEFKFCEKLVVDTRRIIIENGKRIEAYYIDTREDGDGRSSFITPSNFKCIYHESK